MWLLKVLIQFVLAHIPWGERLNYLLQVRSGSHDPKKAAERIIGLAEKIKRLDAYTKLEGSVIMEVGTGWDAINSLLLSVMGAKTVYTYDHVRHTRFKLPKQVVDQIAASIDQLSSITSIPVAVLTDRVKKLKDAETLDRLFELAGIVYVAPGDATRTSLQAGSIDLVYSYAVLEHVPAEILANLTLESKRILKTDGIAYHALGEADHYTSFDKNITYVNFLQYPEWYGGCSYRTKLATTIASARNSI